MNVSAFVIPTDFPEADGTLEWNSTTLVVVDLSAGGTKGIGYIYGDASIVYVIRRDLKALVEGCDVMQIPSIHQAMVRAIRNNGICGLAMLAVSAVDAALWDLKAKVLQLPLCDLLGRVRDEMPVYGSGGFTSYSNKQLQDQLNGWVNEGIRTVKIKVGTHPEQDVERVAIARKVIGNEVGLFVDANGAYSARQAVEKAHQFAEYNVTWFEEPVTSDNLDGLKFIRDHSPSEMNIAAGEYGYTLPYFKDMISHKSVDVLQADATRCGGITGFLKAGHLCEAYHLPFSSHCAPALHLHAAVSLPSFYIAEYFHDHSRIEEMLFDGAVKQVNSIMKPDLGRHGLGIEFKYKDAEKYKVL